MSQESTAPDPEELARLSVEAVNRRDFDALLPYAAPGLVYDTTPSGFLGGMPFAQLLGWCFDDWRRQAGLEPPLPEQSAVLVGDSHPSRA